MREPSRLRKAEEIIELAMMFQNSFRGLCISDIQEHFECSRRSAERMKTLLFDMFPEKIEEVESNDKKKRWRFVKGTMNSLITFNADDFANLEYLKGLRDFRNYIHPEEQVAQNFNPDKNTAILAYHVLLAAMEDLNKRKRH